MFNAFSSNVKLTERERRRDDKLGQVIQRVVQMLESTDLIQKLRAVNAVINFSSSGIVSDTKQR